jgi:hypothetical protein
MLKSPLLSIMVISHIHKILAKNGIFYSSLAAPYTATKDHAKPLLFDQKWICTINSPASTVLTRNISAYTPTATKMFADL